MWDNMLGALINCDTKEKTDENSKTRPSEANDASFSDFFIFHFFSNFFIFRCVRISIRGLVRRSVGRLVGWSVGPSVRNAFVKIAEKWTFTESE